MRKSLLGLVVLSMLLGGCTLEGSFGGEAPTSTPPPPTGQPPPADTATATVSPTMKVLVFFSRTTSNNVEFVAVERWVPRTQGVARAAIEELLKGPTPEEKAHGLDTAIPENARLRSLKIVDGVAYADFDEALQFQVGGSLRVMVIRRTITQTLLQFPTVQRVVISIEGRTEDILQP